MSKTPSDAKSRIRSAFAATIVVLALAGCAATTPAPGASSGGDAPAATAARPATPTPTASTGAQKPAQVFGGNCEAVLTEDAMTNLLGAPVIVGAEDIQFPDDYVVVERGGLHCVWTDPAEKGGQLVNLVVLPAAAVPVPTTKPYDCSAGGADEPSVCYFAVAHSGYFVSGILGTPTHRSAQALTALAKRLVSEVNTAASAAGVPPTVTADGGAWTKPASCKALDSAAGATAASGNPALRVNTGDVGSDLPNGYYLALDSSPYLGCVWTMNATPPKGKLGGFMISLAPGGAWAKSTAVTSASVAVTIDGADAAYSTSDADGIRRVDVFDGANWLQVQPYGSAISVGQVAPVVTALLRSLDR